MNEERAHKEDFGGILDLNSLDGRQYNQDLDFLQQDYEIYDRPDHLHSDDDFRVSEDEDELHDLGGHVGGSKNLQTNLQKGSAKGHSAETSSTNDSKFGKTSGGISSKGIQKKKYEPLKDEEFVYNYEDDPRKYMQIRKKIQNRESARRVRLREKSDTSTIHSRVLQIQEMNQKLLIENGALRSENLMLKNQVTFMEKLILRQKAGEQDGPDQSTYMRDKNGGKGLLGSKLGFIAVSMMVLAVTFLPEVDQGGTNFQQRILAEFRSGFHVFSPRSIATYVLSLIRFITFVAALVMMILWGYQTVRKVVTPSGEEMLHQLLSKKNE